MRGRGNMDAMLARIIAANDQDERECDEWMRESSDAEKMNVWLLIQRKYDDPAMECMSRFAQLAFAQSLARVNRRDEPQEDR